jgi:hypothetical protein
LTRTDSLSWKEKSWVVGIEEGKASKAYDWLELKDKRIINDKIGSVPIVLLLSDDTTSFFVFQRPSETDLFSIRNDTLFTDKASYDFSGRNLTPESQPLKTIPAYQEFWHSWRTFHPDTEIYK